MKAATDKSKMGDGKQNNDYQILETLKDGWVVARSKTYCNRHYYFNTITGESTWNNEKRKDGKKIIQTKQLCSPVEPPGPPDPQCMSDMHPMSQNTSIEQGKCNPVCNNQFYRPQLHDTQHSQLPHSYGQLNFPPYLSNNYLPVQLNVQSPVWAIPSSIIMGSQQSIVSPNRPSTSFSPENNNVNAISIVTDRTTSMVNNTYTDNETGLTNTMQSFANKNDAMKNSILTRTHGITYDNYLEVNSKGKTAFLSKPNKLNANDLRLKLVARRRYNSTTSQHTKFETEESAEEDNVQIESKMQVPNMSENQYSQIDDDYDVHESTPNQSLPVLDVSCLKSLAQSTDNIDRWYIVVDTNVLISNLTFVNMLIKSDKSCRMMVPYVIFTELDGLLHRKTQQKVTKAIRRASRYLSDELRNKTSVVGQSAQEAQKRKLDCTTVDDDILNCCLQLMEQNYHVILLSNDELLGTRAFVSNILLFTVQKIKSLIYRQQPEESLNITIHNNIAEVNEPAVCKRQDYVLNNVWQENALNKKNSTRDYTSNDDWQDNEKDDPNEQKPPKITVKFNNIDKICNTEVNSNTIENNSNELSSVLKKVTFNKTSETRPNVMVQGSSTANSGAATKRSGIQLKRTVPYNACTTSNQQQGTPQYKWHKRKRVNTDKLQTDFKSMDHSDKNIISKLLISKDTCCKNDIQAPHIVNLPKNYNDFNSKMDKEEMLVVKKDQQNTVVKFDRRKDDILKDSSSGVLIKRTLDNSKRNIKKVRKRENKILPFKEQDKFNKEVYVADANLQGTANDSSQGFSTDCRKFTDTFDIRDEIMEDRLITRCDEWVSRFVQIMEEVLTQTLQHNCPMANKELLSAPWSLHEASECIKKVLHHNNNVADAASKLSVCIFKNSNIAGNIMPKIKPAEYMQLYNHGVSLVKALKAMFPDSDDILLAEDLLSKLIYDIKDTNQDTTYNLDLSIPPPDIFSHASPINSKNKRVANEDIDNAQNGNAICNFTRDSKLNDKDTLVNNVKIKTSLNFDAAIRKGKAKIIDDSITEVISDDTINRATMRNEEKKRNHSVREDKILKKSINNSINRNHNTHQVVTRNNKQSKEVVTDKQPDKVQQKVIMNLNIVIPEYEERLQNKKKLMDNLEYSDDKSIQYQGENKIVELEIIDDDGMEGELEFQGIELETKNNDNHLEIDDIILDSEEPDTLSVENKCFNENVKEMASHFFETLSGTFLYVFKYCQDTIERLKLSHDVSVNKKMEIKVKVRKLQDLVEDRLSSLQMLLCKKSRQPENRLEKILSEASANNKFIYNNSTMSYKDIVKKSIVQGQILQETLQLLKDLAED